MSETNMSTSECVDNTPLEDESILRLTENGIEGFEILCRLCANRSDHLIPIYSEEGISNDLSNKMNLYLPVKVSEADTLPLQCCYQCASTVLTWHELVIASVEADRRLRDLQLEAEKHIQAQNATNSELEQAERESDSEDDRSIQEVIPTFKKLDKEQIDGVMFMKTMFSENKIFSKMTQKKAPQCSKKVFLCELCSNIYSSKKEYEDHVIEHRLGGEYVIKLNNDNDTPNEDRLDDELIKVLTEQKKNFCFICNENFLTEIDLHNHQISHQVISEFQDIIIDDSDIQKTEHKIVSKEMIQCEICCRTFVRTSNLNAHLITHTKNFFCYVCCNSYISQFKLDHHMTNHSEEEIILRKGDPCVVHCPFDDCGEIFYSKLQLFEHKKQHKNIVEYKCDHCDKKFVYLRQFNNHKKKHETNTQCDICSKVFSSLKTLQEHVRLHTGERPFQCKFCKMKFRCQSNLNSHEILHSGIKKYKCGVCSRAFARSNYLKEHMRIHFNERPFQCNFCNQTFVQANVLKNHISKKHRQCTICNKTIGSAMQLRMHIWKCHSDSQKDVTEKFVCFEDDQELLREQTVDSSDSIEESLMKQFL